MTRMKMIYAMVLAAIYMAASLSSSLDVLLCNHPHHNHHCDTSHSHSTDCACHKHCIEELSIINLDSKCCDHEHELLGEHHTDFIVEKERSNSAAYASLILHLGQAIISNEEPHAEGAINSLRLYSGYESTPPKAAFLRHDSLRAPPFVA